MAKRARQKGKRNGRRRAAPPPPTFLEQNWRMIAIVFVVFLIVAVSAYAITTSPEPDEDDGNGDNNPPPREPASNFQLTTIDGEPIALDQFRGKVVVLDLMATWCGPCKTQMEHLNLLRAEYPESQVVILSIGVDTSESDQQLREFKEQNFANWRFARDTDGVGQEYDA
nr:redoxin domain-containing protein [Thermoplasmata archaeon]NIS19580.1 redoxin domain-containing protein [Thermoplasmata archaeon]NIT76735.1 redoxin domain-containing protein [Thermoplasmata archaeon]NIU48693.1 redoxin domain-containing protein [Thermoplasmata archaeon]NIV78351.1 redoxin domain-containing protein [Thermoplasmata archaeon]